MTPQPAYQSAVFRRLVWCFLAVMFVSAISTTRVDPDLFHEMALFREARAQGHLPLADPFAYTPTVSPMVQHEWGAGAVAWFLATALGSAGIVLLRYLLAAVVAASAFAVVRRRVPDPLPAFAAAATLAVLSVGSAFSPVRGHLYSLAGMALLLRFLERDREGGRRWTCFWFPLLAVWVNLHGGFTFALILMAVHAGEELLHRRPWRHLAPVWLGSLAVVVVNPYGYHYYPYLWRALTMRRPRIHEWRPLWEAFPAYYAVAFLLSLALVLYTVRSVGLRQAPGIAVLCATAAAATLHQRFLPFYAVALAAYVPGFLDRTAAGERLRRLFRHPPLAAQAAAMLASAFFLAVAVSMRAGTLEVPPSGPPTEVIYPNGAVEYLAAQGFHGNVMTPFESGAYVTWKLYPAVKVSFDSRYEVAYPDWWAERAFACYAAAPGWEETIASYDTGLVLVRRGSPLSRALPASGWQRVYRDADFELRARPGLELPVVDQPQRSVAGRFP